MNTFQIPLLLAGIVVLALAAHFILIKILERITRKVPVLFESTLVRRCREPLRWIIILVVFMAVMPVLKIPTDVYGTIMRILSSAFIAATAWFLIRVVFVIEDHILSKYDIAAKDNLDARKIHTQMQFLGRLANVLIALVALAIILMRFERVQELGTSILASAGIVGIVVGFAAQRTIGTLFAGMQIAWTQPIRIDDVVIVESEWGRIEEITLTYVVVKIWDQRRLVLPITYFVEKPFQNWTRVSSDILGTVFLHVDYTVPVQNVREELQRILEANSLWDRRVSALQVTGTTDRSVELRALMSANDASDAWTLRCEVREKLIDFIQKNYPDALPRVRAEIGHAARDDDAQGFLPG
ncbi:MAG: mechanosensitive ion channel [Deltaproteobacteria bacterium]|nr:mechanosensitive ion channel [Deltaproteobacteria bacterium]